MNITFLIVGLTDLRYYMPLALSLKENNNISFFVVSNNKYNGFRTNNNFNKFKEITSQFNVVQDVSDLNDIDVLITVESVADLSFIALRKKAKKHIAIAHGFDCLEHSKNLKDCIYLIPFEKLKNGIGDVNYDVKTLNVPIPFLYDYEQRVNDKSVFMFYPDSCQVNFYDRLIASLRSDGFTVTVKQRRKHQSIDNVKCDHKLYDDIWWPSEAICGPTNSSITIGFGSTAYTDLAVAGLRYIDIYNKEMNVYPWNKFEFPDIPNYVRLVNQEVDDIVIAVNDMIKLDINLPSKKQREEQINQIILWMKTTQD